MNVEIIFEWDEVKRQKNIKERGLDILAIAPLVFEDQNVVIEQDNRWNYTEKRFRDFAIVEEKRVCLCFTPRNEKMHLITVFRVRAKQWEKFYERKNRSRNQRPKG